MNMRRVLRLISRCKRIKRRRKLCEHAVRHNKFNRFIKQNEAVANFLLKLIEFIVKLTIMIIGSSSKTYFAPFT